METKPRWDNQKFLVLGVIEFTVPNHTPFVFSSLLQWHVREADKNSPWVSYYPEGCIAPSIGTMSEAVFMEGSGLTSNDGYKIQVVPTFHLRPSQFAAYEKYLDKLGKNLANRNIKGVYAINVSIKMAGQVKIHHVTSAKKMRTVSDSAARAFAQEISR